MCSVVNLHIYNKIHQNKIRLISLTLIEAVGEVKGMCVKMNIALVLAAGVGQRMRNEGLPKQFLKLLGKPIVVYTIEKFQECQEIDKIIVICHNSWIDHMNQIIAQYGLTKVEKVVVGGGDRQSSIINGLEMAYTLYQNKNDIVIIHDGVRPLVDDMTIHENIRVAQKYGNAMTVKAVKESVVVSDEETVKIDAFMKREDTYSLTSPQTFRLGELLDAYKQLDQLDSEIPLLDASLVYANLGHKIHLVKEQNVNLKVTTPEDYYYLRAILEMEENRYIFGL